jgi:hypothetical protein
MNLLPASRIYQKEIKKLDTNHLTKSDLLNLYLKFPKWYLSLRGAKDPLSDGIPWITYSATNYLNKYLVDHMVVFEYGSGGSTIYLAKRVKEGVSIEHDNIWMENVRKRLGELRLNNWTINYIPPDKCDSKSLDYYNPEHYAASSPRYRGSHFKAYATSILDSPDEFYDLILLDGRARNSCAKQAIPKVKVGGILVLDNSDRKHYQYIHKKLNYTGWKKRDFLGPGPYLSWFWQTSIWQKL